MLFYHILHVPIRIFSSSFNFIYTKNQLKSYIVFYKTFSAQNHRHWLILYISWLLCCHDFVLRGPEIMSNWFYLSDFDISFVSHISITSVNCEVRARWIIAINTFTPSYVPYPWYLFFLFIVISSIILPTVNSIHIVWFCPKKLQPKLML